MATQYKLSIPQYDGLLTWAQGRGIHIGFRTFSPTESTITLLIDFKHEDDHTLFKLKFDTL